MSGVLSFFGAVAGGCGGAATVLATTADIGLKVAVVNPVLGGAMLGGVAAGALVGAAVGGYADDVVKKVAIDIACRNCLHLLEAGPVVPVRNARARSSSSGRANRLQKNEGQAGSNQQRRNSRREQQEEYSDSNEHDGWRRDPDKDKSLKIKGRVLTESEVLEKLRDAFKLAFVEALKFLRTLDPNAQLDWTQFTVTSYDFIIIRDEEGGLIRGAFPVEIEAIASVRVRGGLRQQFNININLDNPEVSEDLQGPHGPHVGFSIKKVGEFVASVETFVGHIILNRNLHLPDRGRAIKAADLERQSQLWEIREIPIGFLFGQNREFPFRLERIEATITTKKGVSVITWTT